MTGEAVAVAETEAEADATAVFDETTTEEGDGVVDNCLIVSQSLMQPESIFS